jgi:8-oxo-dGTP diphosphatase
MAMMHSLTLGSPQKDVKYETRTAVRCLILKDDKICIIHAKKGNYYKLPGGGVEPEDPDNTVACQREALEETGCEVIVHPEPFAQTTEFRGTLQ